MPYGHTSKWLGCLQAKAPDQAWPWRRLELRELFFPRLADAGRFIALPARLLEVLAVLAEEVSRRDTLVFIRCAFSLFAAVWPLSMREDRRTVPFLARAESPVIAALVPLRWQACESALPFAVARVPGDSRSEGPRDLRFFDFGSGRFSSVTGTRIVPMTYLPENGDIIGDHINFLLVVRGRN